MIDKRGQIMLKVFINRYPPKDALLKFLPENFAKKVREQNIFSDDLRPMLEQPARSVSQMHYSWIEPALKKFPPPLQMIAAGALTEEQATGLKANAKTPISHVTKSFLLNQIYNYLNIAGHTPVEYLPQTELSQLATWSKYEIVELIDFFGIYDLAAEVRKIVNRKSLKTIYDCLSSKQLHFLQYCLQQKERLSFPSMGINPQIEGRILLKAVHKRGLNRLAAAFGEEHRDFVWHVAHILDKGRGSLLLKQYQQQVPANVITILKQQAVHLIHFLKKE